jgi:hypothetical protein
MPVKTKESGNVAKNLRASHFAEVLQTSVPHSRRGKHKDIVTEILDDLANLTEGSAIRIPLKDLTASKEKIRSALSRACQQKGLKVVTSADAEYLYVWPAAKPPAQKRKLIG